MTREPTKCPLSYVAWWNLWVVQPGTALGPLLVWLFVFQVTVQDTGYHWDAVKFLTSGSHGFSSQGSLGILNPSGSTTCHRWNDSVNIYTLSSSLAYKGNFQATLRFKRAVSVVCSRRIRKTCSTTLQQARVNDYCSCLFSRISIHVMNWKYEQYFWKINVFYVNPSHNIPFSYVRSHKCIQFFNNDFIVILK